MQPQPGVLVGDEPFMAPTAAVTAVCLVLPHSGGATKNNEGILTSCPRPGAGEAAAARLRESGQNKHIRESRIRFSGAGLYFHAISSNIESIALDSESTPRGKGKRRKGKTPLALRLGPWNHKGTLSGNMYSTVPCCCAYGSGQRGADVWDGT